MVRKDQSKQQACRAERWRTGGKIARSTIKSEGYVIWLSLQVFMVCTWPFSLTLTRTVTHVYEFTIFPAHAHLSGVKNTANEFALVQNSFRWDTHPCFGFQGDMNSCGILGHGPVFDEAVDERDRNS
jgi:hypothetical protein